MSGGEEISGGTDIEAAPKTNKNAEAAEKRAKSENRKMRLNSVMFRTWLYFLLVTVITLIILWLFQFVAYKAGYSTMKKKEINALGESISERYPGTKGDKEFGDYLRTQAIKNGLDIVVFRTSGNCDICTPEDADFTAEYLSSQFNAAEFTEKDLINLNDHDIILEWNKFYPEVTANDEVNYLGGSGDAKYFVYGKKIDDGVYLYMTAPYEPTQSTVNIINRQLLLAMAVCLLASVIVSYFISERLTKPVIEISQVAKRLGEGDYSVRFEGNGYTEIDNLAQTLNVAAEEIGKTEQMRRDFLANVSHDLRTPLTMIKAYAEMIRDISGSDEVKRSKHSDIIIDEADRLTGLVDDILDLSKLQSGTEELNVGEVNMSALARTVAERFEMYKSRDGYEIELKADCEYLARGDSKKLEQVVYNLMSNAVSYTGESKRVTVTVTQNGNNVKTSVKDYGAGIPPEELDKVWERYYRANQHKRNVIGSGLGLGIVKNILTAHGAQFGVNSKIDEGTEFWFELPLVKTEQPQVSAPQRKLPKLFRRRKKNESD